MKRIAVRYPVLLLPLAFFVTAAVFQAPPASRARTNAASSFDARAQDKDSRAADELDADEYAVISVIINDWGRHKSDDSDTSKLTLLIKDATEPWKGFGDDFESFAAGLKESSKELLAETIEDYKIKNKGPHKLSARFDTKARYALVDADEIDGFFRVKGPGGWEDFYKKYPKSGGFVTFSRVGFNSDRTQALVYQSHSCGGLCGGGSCLLFEKKGGVWVEKGAVGGSWVS
jgi:hypothetical protein